MIGVKIKKPDYFNAEFLGFIFRLKLSNFFKLNA